MKATKSTSGNGNNNPPDDLGYCQGSRKEKAAMLESKCKPQQQPDLDSSEIAEASSKTPKKAKNEEIKERVQLLEKAMAKANYTKDVGIPMDKDDPDYGKPQKGTWTEMRGKKAHNHVHKVEF